MKSLTFHARNNSYDRLITNPDRLHEVAVDISDKGDLLSQYKRLIKDNTYEKFRKFAPTNLKDLRDETLESVMNLLWRLGIRKVQRNLFTCFS